MFTGLIVLLWILGFFGVAAVFAYVWTVIQENPVVLALPFMLVYWLTLGIAGWVTQREWGWYLD